MPPKKIFPKTQAERDAETESWNTWKPASGRKGWSPFNRAIPPAQWRDSQGRPLKADGSLDVEKFIEEKENR